MYYVVMLHIEMFAKLPGELFLGLMAVLFVVAVVYGPFMRRLDFGTVRKNTRPQFGMPGFFCTSGVDTNWDQRSGIWHEGRSIVLSRW